MFRVTARTTNKFCCGWVHPRALYVAMPEVNTPPRKDSRAIAIKSRWSAASFPVLALLPRLFYFFKFQVIRLASSERDRGADLVVG